MHIVNGTPLFTIWTASEISAGIAWEIIENVILVLSSWIVSQKSGS